MMTNSRPAHVQPRVNLAKAMKHNAARRQCPQCGRKAALKRDAEQRITTCRWCDYADPWNLKEPS